MVFRNTHPKMVTLHSKALEIATAEDQGPKILVDGFEESLCGWKTQVRAWNMLIPAVAVDSNLF